MPLPTYIVIGKPLQKQKSGPSLIITSSEVTFGRMNGRSVEVLPVRPKDQPCFVVQLTYTTTRADGSPDYDIIVTDGEQYWLAMRTLGKTKFILSDLMIDYLKSIISKEVEDLI
jgi:hypothetical protein